MNTKTGQYQATQHEIEIVWYHSVEIYKVYSLQDTREPETHLYGSKKAKNVKHCFHDFQQLEHLKNETQSNPAQLIPTQSNPVECRHTVMDYYLIPKHRHSVNLIRS